MQFINLSQELREALNEPALQLLENYDAEIIEVLSSDFDNSGLQEYSDKHTAELRQEAGYHLTRYCDTGDGEIALLELTRNLQPIMAKIKSLFSQFTETKRLEPEVKRLEEELGKPLAILKLDSGFVELLYPDAQRRFNEWQEELHEKVPELEDLTIEEIKADIDGHLTDNDKNRATECEETIIKWLRRYIYRGEGKRNLSAYDRGSSHAMIDLKYLLKKVYEQKKVKAEEERQRQEEEARKEEYKKKWDAAWEYLYPLKLFKKVQHHLTDAEEKKWDQALRKATTAYVNGDSNLASFEASEFVLWREEVAKREEEENKRLRARALAAQYDHELSSEIERFKSSLYAQRQNPSAFLKQTSQGFTDEFSHLLTSEQHEEVRSKYIDVESKKFRELMTSYPDLADYSAINEEVGRWWLWASFQIDYELAGLPSLNFYLRPSVVFESQVTLKRHQGYFLEQLFTFPLNAQEKPLGYFYGVISPDQFFDEDTEAGFWWQTIPIPLIEVIHQGGPLPKTIEVTACDSDSTIYKVRGFKELVLIPQEVAKWLQAFPTLEALVSLDYMSRNVYDIFFQHLQTTGGSASPTATHHASSKKEQVFSLFDEGELPSSPRAKALGLTYKVCQTYYSAWKREHKS